MPARPNPAIQLADQLIQILHIQRDLGPGGDYPLSLSRLRELAGPDPAVNNFVKAVKHRNFTDHALLAQKKDPNTLVALASDVDRLASSDALLLTLLEQLCTPEKPAVPLANLAKKVEKPLQGPLAAQLQQRLSAGTFPETVGSIEIKKKLHLFLKRMPPPPPPKKPEVELAEKLLAALESRRDEATGFPWTMNGLLAAVAADVHPSLVKKALGTKELKARLVQSSKDPLAPVALAEDREALATSPALLEFALSALRTDTDQAIPGSDLKKKVAKDLQKPFAQAVDHRITYRLLPAGVGMLVIKKKPHLFLLRDLEAAVAPPAAPVAPPAPVPPAPPPTEPTPAPIDFATAFETAFTSLDRQRGSLNLVSLVDLRKAVLVDRQTFDRELNELRRAGRFSLNNAEGRHGLSAEEQEAAINENGSLLLFVSRRM